MANTIFKDFSLELQYWAELVLTANYLRNCGPVIGQNLTSYKADTRHKPLLGHLGRIGQIGLF